MQIWDTCNLKQCVDSAITTSKFLSEASCNIPSTIGVSMEKGGMEFKYTIDTVDAHKGLSKEYAIEWDECMAGIPDDGLDSTDEDRKVFNSVLKAGNLSSKAVTLYNNRQPLEGNK